MKRIFAIALKDFQQYLKNAQMYIFMFIMPIGFTLLFGAVFADSGSSSPMHWSIAVLNQDQGQSGSLFIDQLMTDSSMDVSLVENLTESELIERVKEDEFTAALVIPANFTEQFSTGETPALQVYARGSQDVRDILNNSFQAAALVPAALHRQANSAAAAYADQTGSKADAFRDSLFTDLTTSLQTPEIRVEMISSVPVNKYTQSAPGMILQFAISGMTGIAAILVEEKSARTFARIRGTGTSSISYLVGHGLSFLCLLVIQFGVLILFGQVFLGLNYLEAPLSTLMVVGSIILCFTAMGLALGILAKNMGQAIVFSLLAMFLFSALGGAWVPLEIMGPGMQMAGKFSPVSWGMLGFKTILLQAGTPAEVLQPTIILLIFMLIFMAPAVILYQLRKENS